MWELYSRQGVIIPKRIEQRTKNCEKTITFLDEFRSFRLFGIFALVGTCADNRLTKEKA